MLPFIFLTQNQCTGMSHRISSLSLCQGQWFHAKEMKHSPSLRGKSKLRRSRPWGRRHGIHSSPVDPKVDPGPRLHQLGITKCGSLNENLQQKSKFVYECETKQTARIPRGYRQELVQRDQGPGGPESNPCLEVSRRYPNLPYEKLSHPF